MPHRASLRQEGILAADVLVWHTYRFASGPFDHLASCSGQLHPWLRLLFVILHVFEP